LPASVLKVSFSSLMPSSPRPARVTRLTSFPCSAFHRYLALQDVVPLDDVLAGSPRHVQHYGGRPGSYHHYVRLYLQHLLPVDLRAKCYRDTTLVQAPLEIVNKGGRNMAVCMPASPPPTTITLLGRSAAGRGYLASLLRKGLTEQAPGPA